MCEFNLESGLLERLIRMVRCITRYSKYWREISTCDRQLCNTQGCHW